MHYCISVRTFISSIDSARKILNPCDTIITESLEKASLEICKKNDYIKFSVVSTDICVFLVSCENDIDDMSTKIMCELCNNFLRYMSKSILKYRRKYIDKKQVTKCLNGNCVKLRDKYTQCLADVITYFDICNVDYVEVTSDSVDDVMLVMQSDIVRGQLIMMTKNYASFDISMSNNDLIELLLKSGIKYKSYPSYMRFGSEILFDNHWLVNRDICDYTECSNRFRKLLMQ